MTPVLEVTNTKPYAIGRAGLVFEGKSTRRVTVASPTGLAEIRACRHLTYRLITDSDAEPALGSVPTVGEVVEGVGWVIGRANPDYVADDPEGGPELLYVGSFVPTSESEPHGVREVTTIEEAQFYQHRAAADAALALAGGDYELRDCTLEDVEEPDDGNQQRPDGDTTVTTTEQSTTLRPDGAGGNTATTASSTEQTGSGARRAALMLLSGEALRGVLTGLGGAALVGTRATKQQLTDAIIGIEFPPTAAVPSASEAPGQVQPE